jgi:glycosyltransferase involved in cell wall biosynthesis
MKKIAIIICDITKRAGTERAVCNLANLLTESQKYMITIISSHSASGDAAYDINKDIQICHLGLLQYSNRITRLRLYRLLIKKINRICKENNIDIVLATNHGINCTLPFLKEVKTIACEHLNYMAAPFASRILRKIMYSFLDAVVVLTVSDAKHYFFHKNVQVIPNSFSFSSDKQSKLINKVILAVGRLTHQKGFDLLINAISLIEDECKGWTVKIIGAGEDEEKLKKQIEALNLGNLIKIYPTTNVIVQEYLEASIYVLSSRWEGLPMVLIEAQSCGLPIVSFDCPVGPADIVHHNEDGLLVRNGDIYALSSEIAKLICDENKRKNIGKEAIKNSSKFKADNIFPLWDALFSDL